MTQTDTLIRDLVAAFCDAEDTYGAPQPGDTFGGNLRMYTAKVYRGKSRTRDFLTKHWTPILEAALAQHLAKNVVVSGDTLGLLNDPKVTGLHLVIYRDGSGHLANASNKPMGSFGCLSAIGKRDTADDAIASLLDKEGHAAFEVRDEPNHATEDQAEPDKCPLCDPGPEAIHVTITPILPTRTIPDEAISTMLDQVDVTVARLEDSPAGTPTPELLALAQGTLSGVHETLKRWEGGVVKPPAQAAAAVYTPANLMANDPRDMPDIFTLEMGDGIFTVTPKTD